jgi:hypothetical protein
MTISSTTWQERARAAACYLGLLPLFSLVSRWRASAFLTHHYRQAAILFGVLLTLFAVLAATLLVLSYLLVYHRDVYESTRLEVHSLGFVRKLFLAWSVFWAFGLGMALLGAARPMPLIHRLARREWAVRTACLGVGTVYLLLLALVPVAVHASSLVPESRESGAVYMVYEDNRIFPRWLFALAFYPMARAAEATYGPGSAVLLKISRETVGKALAGGRVVFVGSHGTKRGLMLHDDWLLPEDLAAVSKNDALKFVYLTGCDSGDQRDAWVNALAPADVVTYDRLSASLEHAWWLWFRGPEKVRTVYAEEHHVG